MHGATCLIPNPRCSAVFVVAAAHPARLGDRRISNRTPFAARRRRASAAAAAGAAAQEDAPYFPSGSASGGGSDMAVRRELLVAKVYYFLSCAAQVFLLPYIALFLLRDLHWESWRVGLVQGLRPWLAAPCSLLLCGFADRLGAHRAVLVGCFAASVALRAAGLALAATGGAGGSGGASAALVAAALLVSEAIGAPVGALVDAAVVARCECDSDYGRQRMWASIGWGALSTAGGALVSRAGVRAGIAVYVALSVPALVAAWFLSGSSGSSSSNDSNVGSSSNSNSNSDDSKTGAKRASHDEGICASLLAATTPCSTPVKQQDGSQVAGDKLDATPRRKAALLFCAEASAADLATAEGAATSTAAAADGDASVLVSRVHSQQQQQQQPAACHEASTLLRPDEPRSDTPAPAPPAAASPVPDGGHDEQSSAKPATVPNQDAPAPCAAAGEASVLSALASPGAVAFFGRALVIGFGLGVQGNFAFLLVQQLGGSEALMGLMLLASILTEAPAFHFQPQILARAPPRAVIDAPAALLALRLACYSLLPRARTPWAVLPIELLHGVTFATSYGAGVVAAKRLAPGGGGRGSALLQSVFSELYGGVGGGLGAVAGGALMQARGAPRMFLAAAGVVAGGTALAAAADAAQAAFGRRRQRLRLQEGAGHGACAASEATLPPSAEQ